MCELIQREIEGRLVTVYRHEGIAGPIVYASMYTDAGAAVLEACKELDCHPFCLVTITRLHWDEDLSPWAHEPIITKTDHFTGQANIYARFLREKVIPFVEEGMDHPPIRIIAGYSMAGLFALYALYIMEVFSASVSASGSVWYPGFVTYTQEHTFLRKPNAIYLSIGDTEGRSPNPYLRTTERCLKELNQDFRIKTIDSIFDTIAVFIITGNNHPQRTNADNQVA